MLPPAPSSLTAGGAGVCDRSLFGSGWIDDPLHFGDAVGREPPLPGMLENHILVWRDVDAVYLVVGDKALDPLDLRAEPLENAARFLRYGLQCLSGQLPRPRQFPFNYVL